MSHMNRWTHHRWCACSKIELNVSWLLGTRCETTAQVSWLPAPAIKLLMPIPFAVAELTASSLCLTQVWSLSLSSAWSVWLFLISVGGGGRWLSKMITLCHPLKLTTHMLSHVIFSYHPFWKKTTIRWSVHSYASATGSPLTFGRGPSEGLIVAVGDLPLTEKVRSTWNEMCKNVGGSWKNCRI